MKARRAATALKFRDVLAILEATPGKLRQEISSMTARQLRTRPAAGKWSVQEILAHLDDVEELGMRARVAAMVERDRPVMGFFDQEKRARDLRYDRKDPLRSLRHFTRQRGRNVRWLRKLKPAQLKRPGHHEVVGKITAGEMIYEWAFHDLGHLKQIMEAKRYALWPHMGNMRKFYHLT